MNQASRKQQNQFTLRPFMERDRSAIIQFWLELDQHVMTGLDNASRFSKNKRYPDYIDKWLTQYQKNRHSLLMVGESQGVISGFILGHIQCQDWYKEKSIGLIGACYVHSLYRRRGLATQMLEALQNWFREGKVTYLDVVWDEGNADAEYFWQSQGFKRSQIKAHQKLK